MDAEDVSMRELHDLLGLVALVLSGAVGALLLEPLRDALRVARRRF